MPKSIDAGTPKMRAATTAERVGDKVRNVYESVAKQPLARVADALGLTNLKGMSESFVKPDDGIRMGELPGPFRMLGGKQIDVSKAARAARRAKLGLKPGETISEVPEPRPLSTIRNSAQWDPETGHYMKWKPEPKKPEGKVLSFDRNKHRIDMDADVPSFNLVDDAVENASGESSASLEAISRLNGMKSRGERYVVRRPTSNGGYIERDLLGPDGVDYNPRPGEEYGILDAGKNFRLLQRGMK